MDASRSAHLNREEFVCLKLSDLPCIPHSLTPLPPQSPHHPLSFYFTLYLSPALPLSFLPSLSSSSTNVFPLSNFVSLSLSHSPYVPLPLLTPSLCPLFSQGIYQCLTFSLLLSLYPHSLSCTLTLSIFPPLPLYPFPSLSFYSTLFMPSLSFSLLLHLSLSPTLPCSVSFTHSLSLSVISLYLRCSHGTCCNMHLSINLFFIQKIF